jgi:hypothetical protein
MRIGNGKTLPSSERGGLGKVLSRLRRVEDVPPTRWWKRLSQQVASRVSAVRTKRDRPWPRWMKSRFGASTRCTAALAALGLATAGVIALALRRRRAEEGPPAVPAPTGAPAADDAAQTPT